MGSRKVLAKVVLSAVALATLAIRPAFAAFNQTDAAGIRGIDIAYPGAFVDLGTTCGAPCKLSYTDEQVRGYAPATGQPNFPIHWSSDITSPGIAGGSAAQSSLWVSSNGFIAFADPGSATSSNAALPNAGKPGAMIAGNWQDLDPSNNTDGIYVQLQGAAPSRVWVVHFKAVNGFASFGGCKYNFEFQVFESDGHVDVYYGSNSNGTLGACGTGQGGEQNSLKNAGLSYFRSATAHVNNAAVRYADITAPIVSSATAACGLAGNSGWCRSATNSLTFVDNNDAGAGQIGYGIKSRTYSVTGGPSGTYVSGSPASVTTADGTFSATGTATDWAGNLGSKATSFKVDATPPSISGAATTPPNGAGWYNDDVDIDWTCADVTSGVAVCPVTSTITGEGASLSATESASDVAGNSATGSVTGVQIDRTPPVTGVSAPNGWVAIDAVVTLTPTDNLSGVDTTEYSVDGGDFQEGTEVIVTTEGEHTISYRSTDLAGNVEDAQEVTVMVDKSAPAITHTLDPLPNENLWNRDDTTVTFSCTDAISGIASCSDPATVTTEGLGQEVTGTAEDLAGNTTDDTAIVNLDRTAPEIDAARLPGANGNGWSNQPVTVTYTCSDDLSGIASCPEEQVFGEGEGQSASGEAADAADNTATTSLGDIDVDLTSPLITGAVTTAAAQNGWYTGDVNVHWTCSDALSGIDSCPADSTISGEGTGLSVTESVSDLAGNTSSATVTVKIDRSNPVISYAGQSPAANANGWNNTDVTLTWTCTDAVSGATAATDVKVVTGETAGTSKTGTCTDAAGNSSADTQGPVRIDRTAGTATIDAPTIPVLSITAGGEITGTAADTLSGVDYVTVTLVDVIAGASRTLVADCVTGCAAGTSITWRLRASDIGAGIFAATAASTDRAGNTGASSLPVIFVVAP